MRNFTFRWLMSLLVITGFVFTSNAQYLTESFEGAFPPTDWTLINNASGNDWTQNTSATYASDGTNSMKYGYSYSDAADAWAITPAVTLTAGTVVQIIFDYRAQGYDENLKLTVGSNATVASQTTVLFDLTFDFETFETETAIYTVPADGDYYFAYNCYSATNQFNLYIDNIIIQEAPTCLGPTDLTVSGITETEAILSWNPGDTETNWNVEYGIAGFTPGTGTPATASDTFLTASTLAASTDYEFYVQADCGAGDLSYVTGPVSFSTTCGIAIAPYTQTFENAGTIPNCWEQGTSNSEDWKFNNSLSGQHFGNNGDANGTATTSAGYFAWVDDSSPDNTGTTMESPMIDISGLTVPALSFYLLSHNEGHSNAELVVNVWDGAVWTNVYTNQANTVGWEEVIIDLSAFSGTIKLNFVVNELTSGDWYDDIAIDDISVSEAPTCFKPISLMADVSAFSSVLSWTPGSSETNFYIEYGESGFAQGSGTISSVADTFFTATSLTATTNYEFYVQADCGSGDLSLWAGPYSFTTLLSCQFPSDLTSSDVTSNSAVLSWIMGNAETNWNVEYGEDGFTQGAGTIEAVTDTFLSLSTLTSNTTYQFYVQADCGASEVSTWSGPYSFTTLLSCQFPTDLTSSNITSTSATLSWIVGDAETNWNVEYGEDGFTQGAGTTEAVTDTFINLSTLTSNTEYQFYVQADCGAGDLSPWTGPYSFTTPCDIFTPNYTENFDTFIPGCWSEAKGPVTGPTSTGTAGWGAGTFTPTGSAATRINLYAASKEDWLISPAFDLSAGGVYLTFDVAVYPYSGSNPIAMGSDDEVKLMFTTDNGATWLPMKTWNASTAPAHEGDHYALDMTPLPNANVRFAFWASEGTVNDTEDYYFFIDNFELRPVSAETDFITYDFAEATNPASIDASAHTVAIEVGDGIDLTNLVANFTLSPFGTAMVGVDQQFSGTTINNFTNPVVYTVIAEDGSTSQDWTVTVTNAAVLDAADIISFSFDEETAPATIDAANQTVDIEINWMADLTSLNATVDLSYGATTNQSYTDFSAPVQYTVVAEDGVTTLIWTVNVTQEGLPQGARCIDPLPLTLPVVGEAGNTALFGNDYNSSMTCGSSYMNGDDIVYEFTITAPSLLSCSFTTTDSWPGIFVLDGCPDDATSQCIISETASGQSLSFNDEYITPGTYFFIISSYPSPQTIDFIFDLSAAITLNNEAEILTYSIPTQSSSVIVASNDSIRVAMPAGTDLSTLVADFTISNAAVDSVNHVVQATGVTANDWTTTNPVVHTVTAEDGTIRNWSVWVETAGDEAEMLTFAFADETAPATFDNTARTVDIEINWLADISNLTANYTLSYGATTTQTETNFTAPVVYTILSEDGLTTNDWTVTVTQEATPLGALCSNPIPAILGINSADLTVNDQWFTFTPATSGDMTITSCTHATVDTRLWVYSDCPAATLVDDSDDDCSTQSEVIIAVTAGTEYFIQWGDNYTQTVHDFEITVGAGTSNEAEVLTYMLPGQDESSIVAASDSINVTMPYGSVFPFTLAAEFTLSADANATVATVAQISTTTDNTWADNMTPVVYEVTAEDGTTIRSWSVYVDIAPVGIKSVNNNNDVTVYPNPNNGLFNIALNLNVKAVDMIVVNMQGQTVANFKNVETNSTQSIDLSHVASGVYYIRISSDNETIIKKVNILN